MTSAVSADDGFHPFDMDDDSVQVSETVVLRPLCRETIEKRFGQCFVRLWTYRLQAAPESQLQFTYKCELGVYCQQSCTARFLISMASSSPFCCSIGAAQHEAIGYLLWNDELKHNSSSANHSIFFT